MQETMLRRKTTDYDPKYSGKPNVIKSLGKKYFSEIKHKIPSLSGILVILLVGYIIVDRIGRNWGKDNVKFDSKGKLMDGNYTGENPKIKGVNDLKHQHKSGERHIDDPQEKEFLEVLDHNAHLKEGEAPKVPVFDPNLHIQEKHEKLAQKNPDWQNKIIHPQPKDFPVKLLKEPTLECEKPITLLLLVHTQSNHFGERRAIRQTWGIHDLKLYERFGKDIRWKTIFVLGKTNEISEKIVDEEATNFKDILQGDFRDNEFEDTKKFMMSLKWLTEHKNSCKPRFIMKTGDNIFHNLFSIIDWLDNKFKAEDEKIYMGRILKLDRPVRDEHDAMYVSMKDYDRPFFPDLIRGPVYLFDSVAFEKLAAMMYLITPIAPEDGYIGVLAARCNLKPIHNDHFQMLEKTSNVCHNLRLFFIYKITAYQHILIFKANKNVRKNNECPHAQAIGRDMKARDIQM